MSWLGRLFGGGTGEGPVEGSGAEVVEYDGYRITPTPMAEGNAYRLCARIERDDLTHTLIRADTFTDREEATQASVAKARQMIDEQGASLFG